MAQRGSMAQHGAAGRSMAQHLNSKGQHGTAGRSIAQHLHSMVQHDTAGAHRQGFIGIVEVGQVGNPGAVPGHLVAVQQEAPKQQKHHDG